MSCSSCASMSQLTPKPDPLDRITRPEEGVTASERPVETDESVAKPSLMDQASAQFSGLQRALTINEGDPVHVGAIKILGMILAGALVLGLSPLIILGLIAGFAAAA